jgi:hypothetical protein
VAVELYVTGRRCVVAVRVAGAARGPGLPVQVGGAGRPGGAGADHGGGLRGLMGELVTRECPEHGPIPEALVKHDRCPVVGSAASCGRELGPGVRWVLAPPTRLERRAQLRAWQRGRQRCPACGAPPTEQERQVGKVFVDGIPQTQLGEWYLVCERGHAYREGCGGDGPVQVARAQRG